MPDRLTRSDAPTLIAWVVAGIIGIVIAMAFFPLAIREAAVDFRVNAPDAERIARDLFRARGIVTDGWIGVSTLDHDREAQAYLERELGPDRANALMAGDVAVSAFQVRLFRDSQQEELSARVAPSGRVVGMRRVVPEARAGPRLEREDARRIADAFLRSVDPRPPLYAFLADQTSSIERPARRDWTFTWERADLKAAEAPYRLTVTVIGDEVGALEQGLRIPDAWKRDFSRLRSENYLYGSVSTVFYVLLLVAAVVLLVRHARRGALRWRPVVVLTLVLGAIIAAQGLNALQAALATYDTRESYAGFVLRQIVTLVAAGLIVAAITAAQAGAGEPAYREGWPDRLRLWSAWRLRAIGSKEAFRAAVIGLSFAAAHLGFVVVFYLIGIRVGVWAPQEIRYDDALTSPLPWLVPIGIGIQASLNEETAFRLLAIPLVLGLTRSRAVAVVAPALVWSFLHSSYAVEPGFVRGIELGIVGTVAGLVFLRWGLLPVLIWHYAYDAGLIGIVIARWGHASFQLSAAVVAFAVLAPVLATGGLYLARRSFAVAPALLNTAEPLPPAPPSAPSAAAPGRHEPATRRIRTAMLVAGLGGALVYATIHPPGIGAFINVAITADEAVARGDRALRERGIDPTGYQRLATFGGYPSERRLVPSETKPPDDALPSGPTFDPLVNEYLRREVGIDGANALYRSDVPSAFWSVRYFRELDRREHFVLLQPDGETFAVWRRIEEAAPGATLTEADATAIAERYLRDMQRQDVSRWRVVESSLLKRPARTDANIVLERRDAIGEAHLRAEVRVADREVIAYRVFVKLPEEWERRERQQGFAGVVAGIGRVLVIAAVVVAIAVLFFRKLRAARIPWRELMVVAGVGVASFPLSALNGARDQIAAYPTDVPLTTYFGLLAFSNVTAAAALFGLLLVLCGAAWLFASEAFGDDRLRPALTPAYWRDALVLGIGAAGTLLGLGRLGAMVATVWPADQSGTAAALPGGVDLFLPAAQALAGATTIPLAGLAIVAIAAGAIARYIRPPLVPVALIALVVVIGWEGGHVAASIRSMVIVAVQVLVAYLVITRALRWNAAAYLAALATPPLVGTILGLARQPHAWYVVNAALAATALVALYAVPLILWRRTGRLAILPPVTREAPGAARPR
jgi:hypothetical protein